MLTIIVSIIVIMCVIFGIVTALLKLGRDAKLEKYYRESVADAPTEVEYIPKSIGAIPKEIIVDSEQSFSPLRVYLKKKLAQLRRKEIPPVILIFAFKSEDEQKAFLMQKAFASSIVIQLVDIDFLEGLVSYLSYKYAHRRGVEATVTNILRRGFEKSEYREHLINLDSLEFSKEIVLNPPPELKPLLTNLVLPMVGEKEKEIRKDKMNLTEIEKYKSLFMRIINGLNSKECKILFVGRGVPTWYVNLINENIQGFNSIILSARGVFIGYVLSLYKDIKKTLEDNWKCKIGAIRVAGAWEFVDGGSVNCSWIILMEAEKFPSAFSDREFLPLE